MPPERPVTRWAWTSLVLAGLAMVSIGSCMGSMGSYGGDPDPVITGLALGAGPLAVIAGVIALMRRKAANRSGGRLAALGIVLGLLGSVPAALLGLLLGSGGITSGRPFRVRGRKAQAKCVAAPEWSDEELAPQLDALSPDARAALARKWTQAALDEHASIAAFARLQLELLAVGAPPRLISAAQDAAADEIRHARLCFTVARAFGALNAGPGSFPKALTPSSLPSSPEAALRTLALESLRDGCVNEGLAAAVARRDCERAEDPALRRVLGQIAVDEARHAALGWDIVAWCMDQCADPAALREALLASLRDHADHRADTKGLLAQVTLDLRRRLTDARPRPALAA